MTVQALTRPPLSDLTVQDIVDRILSSRRITRYDQHLLFALNSLNADEQSLINQVFDRLRRGFLKVVDE